MAKNTLQDLNYGHPGAASYDLDHSRWSFARQPPTRVFKQVQALESSTSRVPTMAIPPSSSFPTYRGPPHNTSAQKASRSLIQRYPQLAPSSGIISSLSSESSATQNTAATYDPFVGDLLSFGSTTTRGLRACPRRIAAIPTGEAGNILRLVIIHRVERLNWGPDQSRLVELPTLKRANCGYWYEDATPIQQVCFAQSSDSNTILAVRLSTRIVFLRLRYHSRRQVATPSQLYHLPASTIKAYPILKLGIDETGGAVFVHATFNPDYQLQFGIVDENRMWSVWDIEHISHSGIYSINRTVHGSIAPPDVEESVEEDGWARILWVGDVNTILVCCRRQLSLISMNGDTFEYLPCPEIFVKGSLDWILDVRPHPRLRDRVFVLTSTFLLLMAVTTPNVALNATAGPAGVRVLSSWRHYRGLEDVTLQISVQMLSNDELFVILYSRLNHLIQVYSFSEIASNATAVVVASDPVRLDLTLDSPGIVSQLHIEPMLCDDSPRDTMSPGSDQSDLEPNIRFYRLFATRPDLSVHELVIAAYKFSTDGDLTLHDNFSLFSRNIVKYRWTKPLNEVINDDDDFIVPDGINTAAHPTTLLPLQTPQWTRSRGRILSHHEADYRLLHDALTQTGDDHEESMEITDFVDQVRHLLTLHQETTISFHGTLLEAASLKLHVQDVDDASMMLQELFLSEAEHMDCITSTPNLRLPKSEEATLADVYDTILQNWIAPLPREIPVQIRQRRELLARRIAAEVILASKRTRCGKLQISSNALPRVPSQGKSIALPILPSRHRREGISSNTEKWSLPSSPPILPHSAVPSSSIPSSSPPVLPSAPPVPSDPVSRLNRYLKIEGNSPAPFIVPKNISHLLEHWDLGSDPHTYDWTATETTLREEREDEASQKKRGKDRKKRKRRERRQARENQLALLKAATKPVPHAQSSQGPVLESMDTSSQITSQTHVPVPLPRPGFAGTGGMNMLAPASQVQPGRFGGRQDVKKKNKKKGRISGF